MRSSPVTFLGNRTLIYSDSSFGVFEGANSLAGGDKVQAGPDPEKDDAWWSGARPIELTDREQGIFEMTEQLQQTNFYKAAYGVSSMLITGFVQPEYRLRERPYLHAPPGYERPAELRWYGRQQHLHHPARLHRRPHLQILI